MRESSETKRVVNKISLIEHRSTSKFTGLLLKVRCIDTGEVEIPVAIGNKPSLKNPHPIISVGIVR